MTRKQWTIIGGLSVVVAILFVLLAVMFFAALPRASMTSVSAPTPTPSLLKAGKPSYLELCSPKVTANLTSAQGKAYIDKLKGTRIQGWRSYVRNVDSISLFGTTLYQVMLSQNPDLHSWNISVDTADKLVLSLTKGQLWEFNGTIKGGSVVESAVCMFYLDLDDDP